MISIATASSSFQSASVRCSSAPAWTLASSPSRIARPSRWATTIASKSRGSSSRPCRRMVRSECSPMRVPTGAARFWARSASTTCPTPMPAASSAEGRSSTVSSGSSPPTTVACATPCTERSSPTMPGSAIRVRSAAERVCEVSARVTIGASAGSKRVMTGSSISCGRSWRFEEIASRISCEACCRSLPYSKVTVNCASPSIAVDRVCEGSRPLMAKKASSSGSTSSRSTVSGSAPG